MIQPLKQLLHRKRKSLCIAAVLLACGYAVAMHVDWWLYHLHSDRAAGRELAPVQARIRAAALPLEAMGTVSYQGAQWPLQALLLNRRDARRTACIFGGMHGNEPAGVEAALALAEDLARDPRLHPQFSFVIVPLSNPWGWAHDLRHNGANRDVARSFTGDGTLESALIKQLLARHRCDILADLHEDRIHAGFYMLTYENKQVEVARNIAREVESRGIPLYTTPPGGVYHLHEAEFGSIARTTLALYARRQGVVQSYIVETPARRAWNERVMLHRLALDRLLQANAQ